MGQREARDYEYRYHLRVMASTGREAIVRGHLAKGLGVIGRLVRHWPNRLSTYVAAARMIAGAAVDRFPFLRSVGPARTEASLW